MSPPPSADSDSPKELKDAAACAEAVVDRVGKDIRLAMPLGLGKANLFANALYNIAEHDPSVRLRIYTALTLETPRASSELERRLLQPIVERVFAGYPELEYARARRKNALPANIEVEEFFLATGTLLNNEYAQRHYNSVNYTHALRRILNAGVNVVGQMVAQSGQQPGRYSLSCNSDITLDLLPALKERAAEGAPIAIVGEVNDALPYMPNDAAIPAGEFDFLLRAGSYTLFAPPAPRVSLREHAIGLHAARLVKDGGTLQIGIGSLGDAVAHGLLLRHQRSALFSAACAALGAFSAEFAPDELGGVQPFKEGLYACSEMVTQGLFELLRQGIVARAPHEDSPIVLDGGFFLGPTKFYDDLRHAPDALLEKINMTRVADVNDLYGDEMRRRRERKHARFINIAMKATALGAVASDALEDGRVVSGVGGQYNFAAQAHELEGGRSIILVRSTHRSHGKLQSNIVWSYGHVTVPRHLRDIVVTEYGVADLRGQPDEEVVKRMISVCDARFQDDIVDAAKRAGKLKQGFQIPDRWRANTPDRISAALKPFADACLQYPFGTDLTETEQTLAVGLKRLKEMTDTKRGIIKTALGAALNTGATRKHANALKHLELLKPNSLREKLYQTLVAHALDIGDQAPT